MIFIKFQEFVYVMMEIQTLLVLKTLMPRVVYVVRQEWSIKMDNAKKNVTRVIKIKVELVNVLLILTVLTTLTTWVVFVVRKEWSIKCEMELEIAKNDVIQIGKIIMEPVNVGPWDQSIIMVFVALKDLYDKAMNVKTNAVMIWLQPMEYVQVS